MKSPYYLLAGALLLATTGCEKIRQTQEAYQQVSRLGEAGTKMEQGLKDTEARHAERVKTGDTLALPYQDLEAYLPATLGGYTGEAPKGESVKSGAVAYSEAGRTYKQGPNTAEVKLVDYNGATALYQMATLVMNIGLASENDESLTRTTTLVEGVKALEEFNKKTGDASLTAAVGDRFLLTVKVSGQKDLAQTEALAKQLDLAGLRKL